MDEPSIQVLHVVAGEDYRGGTMAFAVGLASTRSPGIEGLVWKHRDFKARDTGAKYVCQGKVRITDLSIGRDLLGAALELFPLWCWVRRNRRAVLHAHSRTGIFAAAMVSWLTGTPLVIHLHFLASRPRIYRLLWRWTRAVPVFNSRKTCEHYGSDPAQALVIPPPITWPSQPAPEVPGPIRFVAASYYMRGKNLHLLIEAFNRLTSGGTEAELIIYGLTRDPLDPVYQNELIQAAKPNPRITLAEYDPAWTARLRATDIFVHAATAESFGIVMLEAFARGCRLVVPERTFLADLSPPAGAEAVFVFQEPEADYVLAGMKLAMSRPACGRSLWELRKTFQPLFSFENGAARLAVVYRSLLRGRSN